MSEVPTKYNELVQLIENNDAGTAAQVIQDTHVPREEVQKFIDAWNVDAERLDDKRREEKEQCADELEYYIND